MIIYYDVDTKTIVRTEDNTMVPLMPFNSTFEQQKAYYYGLGQDFVSLPYEMGAYIYNFDLNFNIDGFFIGLQPK